MLGIDFEPRNLGTGRADAAGDAWNVDCAYARSFPGVPGSIGPPIDTGLGFPPFIPPFWLLLFCCPCLFGRFAWTFAVVTESDIAPSTWAFCLRGLLRLLRLPWAPEGVRWFLP